MDALMLSTLLFNALGLVVTVVAAAVAACNTASHRAHA
jgi:hypothetical protein